MAMIATIFTNTGTATGVMIIFFLIFDSILYTISDFIPLFEQVANNYVGKLFLDIVNIDAYSGGERLQLVLVPEIGRASCRERVEMWVGEVVMKVRSSKSV